MREQVPCRLREGIELTYRSRVLGLLFLLMIIDHALKRDPVAGRRVWFNSPHSASERP